jgi:hypothetical protein
VARQISDAWHIEVTAPDGAVLIAPGGTLFVPPASGRGWWCFEPGTTPRMLGPRVPAPGWQKALNRVPARTAGGCVVEQLPAGLLMRPAESPEQTTEDLCFAMPVHLVRPTVLIGTASAQDVAADEVAAVLAALPSAERSRVRLAPGGARDPLPLAQSVADMLDMELEVLSGMPLFPGHGLPGESARPTVLGRHGRPTWQPFVSAVTCVPATADGKRPAPRLAHSYRPFPGQGSFERGVLQLTDRWEVAVTRAGLAVGQRGGPRPPLAALPVDPDTLTLEVGVQGRAMDSSVFPALSKLLAGLDARVRARTTLLVRCTLTGGEGELRRLATEYGVPGIRYVTARSEGPAALRGRPPTPSPQAPASAEPGRGQRTAAHGAVVPRAGRGAASVAAPEIGRTPSTGEEMSSRVSGEVASPGQHDPEVRRQASGTPQAAAAVAPGGPRAEGGPSSLVATENGTVSTRETHASETDPQESPTKQKSSVPARTAPTASVSAPPAAPDMPTAPRMPSASRTRPTSPRMPEGPASPLPGAGSVAVRGDGAATAAVTSRESPSPAEPSLHEPVDEAEPENGASDGGKETDRGPQPAPAPTREEPVASPPDGPPPAALLSTREPARPSAPPAPSMNPATPQLLPGHVSSDAERAAFRELATGSWDRHGAAISRLLTRMPALRGHELETARVDLVALHAYLTTEDGPLHHGELARDMRTDEGRLLAYASCLASALRRLPSYRGVTLRGADSAEVGRPPGTLLWDRGPVSSLALSSVRPEGAPVRYAIWSVTGRSVRQLLHQPKASPEAYEEVVFAPGTGFRVLGEQSVRDDSVILLRELPGAAAAWMDGAQELSLLDRKALTRLQKALEQGFPDEPGPDWPERCVGPIG